MNTPLVSVICLCYNQKDYVGAAIRSVLTQTYRNIELIVVDDASNDGSQEVIKEELIGTTVQFIELEKNIGNCAAFNKGYELSKGAYLIDLAADDLLLPFRIEIGLGDFMKASAKSGIHFSDAFMINVDGSTINTFYERGEDGQLINTPPSGDIFQQLIEKYFICPPTMMFKREVLDRLNGYDEHLRYEDFDFWIRSSREFEYIFNPAPLVKKRDVPKSLGKTQFSIRSKHFQTTYQVCDKALDLCQSASEISALIDRCKYEIKQCVKTLNLSLIAKYHNLIKDAQRRLSSLSSMDK